MFAYGFLSVVLVLYLAEVGLSETVIGVLLSLTLLGDTAISLWVTTVADRIGRRGMLIVGSLLMLFAGMIFAFTNNIILLIIAAIIGVISPSGYEVGPFLAIEQAALTQTLAMNVAPGSCLVTSSARSRRRSVRSLAPLPHFLQGRHILLTAIAPRASLRRHGVVLALMFSACRMPSKRRNRRAYPTDALRPAPLAWRRVETLRAVGLDAFAGGFVMRHCAFGFHIRFGSRRERRRNFLARIFWQAYRHSRLHGSPARSGS
jgi:hypothetical protein